MIFLLHYKILLIVQNLLNRANSKFDSLRSKEKSSFSTTFPRPFCSITNAKHSQSRHERQQDEKTNVKQENRSNFSLRIANERVIRFTRKYIRRTSRGRGDTRRIYDNGGLRINVLALHVCACVTERRGYRSQLRCINSLRVDTRWCTL